MLCEVKKKLVLSAAISAVGVFGLLTGCSSKQEEIPKAEISTVVQSTESETEKADLSTYVDDVLVPQYGQCNTGKYECEYVVNSNGGAEVDSVHSEKGILNWNVDDYDGDGTEELLVLLLDNQAKIHDDPIDRNSISLQMYAEENGSIELKDTYGGLCPVLGYGDEENDGIFLKESNQKIYICGSTWNTIKNYATGIVAQSFILTYESGKFIVQAGQTESVSGSEFSECADTVSQMADILRKIGLEKEADQLYVPAFQFNDSVDQTLLRIIGENKGFKEDYFTSNNAEDLGKVELTLTCSDIEDEKGEEELEQESESEKVSRISSLSESKQRDENRLDLIGDWTIDSDRTNNENTDSLRRTFGSSLSYGYGLTFSSNGTFSWYIAAGNGGEGTYKVNEMSISCEYTDYEENQKQFIDMNWDEGEILMKLDWGGGAYKVYWMKQNSDGSSDTIKESEDYILPDSDSRYLTDSDVRGLSANELMLARNEIYARHGRKFKDSELQNYFNSKSWYRGTVDPDDFSTDVFNEYENKNLEMIQKYEK